MTRGQFGTDDCGKALDALPCPTPGEPTPRDGAASLDPGGKKGAMERHWKAMPMPGECGREEKKNAGKMTEEKKIASNARTGKAQA
jgi:hypothetical protein